MDILIPNIFWLLPIIRVFKNTNEFEAFLRVKRFHQNGALISGYKMLIRQAMRDFFVQFDHDSLLGLTEDFETSRAYFVGVDYGKFTSTCEKANMMRNVQKMRRDIRASKDLSNLQRSMDVLHDKLFMPLEDIFKKSFDVAAGVPCDKDRLLNMVGASRLMNPVRRSLPSDEPVRLPLGAEMFGVEIEEVVDEADKERAVKFRKKKEYTFPGYKIGLAFVLDHFISDKKLIDDIIIASDWEILAKLATAAEKQIDAQLTRESGKDAAFGKFFSLKKMPDKWLFGDLIRKSDLPVLSRNETIDQLLLWYQFEVIDSARAKLFSGGSTLRSLILGEIGERRVHGVKDRLEVIRFLHQQDIAVFSYGILIERFGTISDLSGWLIFMEVGGDYQGMGGFEYRSSEQVFERNKEFVNIRQFDISTQELRDYFNSKEPNETARLKNSFSDLERRHADARGRLLEFLVKSYYDSKDYDARLYFADPKILPRKMEVDILAVSKDRKRLVLIECSTNIEATPENLIIEMNDKEKALRGSREFDAITDFQKIFVTPEASIHGLRSGKEIVNRLRDAGIEVVSIESIIRGLPKRFHPERLLPLFHFNRRKNEFEIDEDALKYFRRDED